MEEFTIEDRVKMNNRELEGLGETALFVRNQCIEMPIVILRKELTSGEFSVFQRLGDEDQLNEDLLGDFSTRYRYLQARDYLPFDDLLETRRALRGNGESSQYTHISVPSLVSSFSMPARRAIQAEADESNLTLIESTSTASGDKSGGGEYFLARACDCLGYDLIPEPRIYCPMETTTCREVINDSALNPEDFFREQLRCENPVPRGEQILHSAAVYVVAIFGGVLILGAFLTHFGRSAMSYLPSLVSFGKWNDWQVDRLLRDKRELALRMIWTHFRVRQEQLERQVYREIRHQERNEQTQVRGEDGQADATTDPQIQTSRNDGGSVQNSSRPPVSLSLKTCIYNPKSDASMDDKQESEEEVCIICMTEINAGDRVGALPCGHVFHVSCLKPWLQRCNVCPMCKKENIAKANYDVMESTTDASTNEG